MKKAFGRAAKLVFFLALGLFLVWLAVRDFSAAEWQHIREIFLEANYWLLFPILIIGFLGHFFRALRWRLLIRPLGYNPGIWNTFGAVMTGYLTNLAIPRLGELVRCGVLSRQERIPVMQVVGTMVAERVIDILSLTLVILLTIFTQPDRMSHFFYTHIWIKITDSFDSDGMIWVVLILILIFLSVWVFFRFSRRTRWHHKLVKLSKEIKEGLFTAYKLPEKALFFIYTLLLWLCYISMVYIGFYCFNVTSTLGIEAALSVLSFGSIGMVATQGGLGAYQLLVEKTLNLYGIGDAYGFAFGWLSWLAQTGLILLLGFVSMIVLPFTRKPAVPLKDFS